MPQQLNADDSELIQPHTSDVERQLASTASRLYAKIPEMRLNPNLVVECRITRAVSPSDFWIQLKNNITKVINDEIREGLDPEGIGLRQIYAPLLQRGSYCLAPYASGDYYRAVVLDVKDNSKRETLAFVLFIDEGLSSWVVGSVLLPLELSLKTHPWQAIRCHLAGVAPYAGQVWMEEANKAMLKVCSTRQESLNVKMVDWPTETELFESGVASNFCKVNLIERLELPDARGDLKESLVDLTPEIVSTSIDCFKLDDGGGDFPPPREVDRNPPETLEEWQQYALNVPRKQLVASKVVPSGRKRLINLKPASLTPSQPSTSQVNSEYSGQVWVGGAGGGTDPRLLRGPQIPIPTWQDAQKWMHTNGELTVWLCDSNGSPGEFWVYPVEKGVNPQEEWWKRRSVVEALGRDLDQFYGLIRNRVPVSSSQLIALDKGEPLFGVCKRGDGAGASSGLGLWERVQVLNAPLSQDQYRNIQAMEQQGRSYSTRPISDSVHTVAKVRFLDGGGVGDKLIQDIFKIDQRFCALPAQTLPCGLLDLRPPGGMTFWPERSLQEFRSLIRVDIPHKATLALKTRERCRNGEDGVFKLILMKAEGEGEGSVNQEIILRKAGEKYEESA